MKRAVVTGGSGALGAAICRSLAAAGLHVIVHGHARPGRAEAVAKEIRAAGGSAETVVFDVCDGAAAAGARGTSSASPHGQAHGHAGAGSRLAPAGSSTNGPAPAGSGAPGGLAAATDPRSSCRAVAHIGDSTSDGLISPDYLPDRSQRMAAQYADVGVRHTIFDISGARSVVETLPGQVNGYDAAKALVREGFRGCWVIALGTDDTADVAVGSAVGRMARIGRMMSVAAGEPVLWIGVKTLLNNGPYAEANMQLWNATLRQACARYPNMRIFDWGVVARPRWFISDGTHYTSAGYAARARLIRRLSAAGPADAYP